MANNAFPTIIPKDISNLSKDEELLYKAFHDQITFGKLFDPGNFRKSATPGFHREIATELDRQTTKPLAIIIARGHAKTTLMKNNINKKICFARKAYEWGFTDEPEELFIGWVSDNQSKAKNNIRYLKKHIEANEKIRYYFGDLRGDTWSKQDLSFTNGSRVFSRSSLTSLRGETQTSISSGELRYSYVIADDVENEDNVKTKNSRENLQNVIMDGIFPAIDKHKGRMIWVGTPIHKLAFTQKILDRHREAKEQGNLDDYTWKVISYAATQPDKPGGVLWDSYMPREVLDKIKDEYRDSPRGISGYFQEYELQVQSDKDSFWNQNHIKYWEGKILIDDSDNTYIRIDNGNEQEVRPVNIFIGVDPATDVDNFDTDYSVIMAIAIDSDSNIYVVDYVMRRGIPSRGLKDDDGNLLKDSKKGIVDYIFDYIDTIHPTGIRVEDVGMNRSVFNDYRQEQHDRKDYSISLNGQKTGNRNKRNRIYSWINSYLTSGKVYIKPIMAELEGQIIQFGAKMGHDDVIDAFSYAVKGAYPPFEKENDDGIRIHRSPKRKPKPWTHA